MMFYRISGALIAVSAAIGLLGQFLAAWRWDGIYSLTHHLNTDLGMLGCDQVRDWFGPRYICSPGHEWFNGGWVASGVFLLAGGLILALGSRGPATRRMIAATPVGITLALAGVPSLVTGLIPVDSNRVVNAGSVSVHVVMLWIAMVLLLITHKKARNARAEFDQLPAIHGAGYAATIVVLVISVMGAVGLLAFGLNHTMPGFFERLTTDTLQVWVILFGASVAAAPNLERRLEKRGRRQAKVRAEKREAEEAVRRAAEGH